MNNNENDNDGKLKQFLKNNKAQIPAAPRDELAVLMKRMTSSAPPRRKFWTMQYATALAACLVFVVSVFAIRQSKQYPMTSEQETVELAKYAFDAMAEVPDDETDLTVLAAYSLEAD
jgi:hypothetical protein